MKMCKKILCLLLACTLFATLFAACGSSEDPFQVLFAAPFVSNDEVQAFGKSLTPQKDAPVKYTSLSMSSNEINTMSHAASITKLSSMILAGEVDVLVCDLATAAGFVESDAYYNLTELLTQSELIAYADRLIAFDRLDDNGVPTGKRTPVCGISITNSPVLSGLMTGDTEEDAFGVFILRNTDAPDVAKSFLLKIANS